jgi:hypothetical protein
MQKTTWFLLLLAFFMIATTACDNEIAVAADWEEVVIVYGALNPEQSKNYIRIQRAYLDQNQAAISFSNIQDSLYFDTLDVKIEEYTNGKLTNIFTLNKINGNDIGLPKDSGVFYSENNILYELDEPIKASISVIDYDYKLIVTNPKTGHVCTGFTRSLGKPEVSDPVNDLYVNIPVNVAQDHSILLRYQEGKWVRSYSFVMDMRIEEFSINDPTQKVVKTVRWNMLTDARTNSLAGFAQVKTNSLSVNFFYSLAAALKEDPSIQRRLLDFDIKVYGISDDFNTYLSVNEPSIGIVQKKPEFTNMTNALGLFTSRHIKVFENLNFNNTTLTQINLSDITKNLGFVE